jgi:MtN3 and saliva related transmembrane protein
MIDNQSLIGFIAGILTTIAYIPQIIQVWRSKSAKDISSVTFAVLTTGIILWAIYGFEINSMPLIISSIISAVFACAILIFKLLYDWHPKKT